MSTKAPDKLGLALAGGGFRASLYHLGVLRRLAELDVLRHVQVLSTVSGGSIVGAIYILRLKRWLEDPTKGPRLSSRDYVNIVNEVDDILCRGVAKNLRTRLLLNPGRMMRVMLTDESLGRAMSRLYETHLLREAREREAGGTWKPGKRKNRVDLQLSELRIWPAGADLREGIDAYNTKEEAAANGSVITSIIVNATSLNSGGRFFFTGGELGDWYLGYYRRDEVDDLLALRTMLRAPIKTLEEQVGEAATSAMNDVAVARETRRRSLVLWWRQRQEGEEPGVPDGWERLFTTIAERFPGDLSEADFGLLRQAKIAAWYHRYGSKLKPPVTGGRTIEELWERVVSLLAGADRVLARNLRGLKAASEEAGLFCEFLIELYLLRTAERMSPHFERDWDKLSIADAVGASACFPPVFPPFVLLGLYDDAYITRLGLTDGGAYDNVGVTALLDEGCTSIVASDTGGVFDEVSAAPSGHLGMVVRLPTLLMRAVGGFQHAALRERKRVARDLLDVGEQLPGTPDCAAARELLAYARADRDLNDVAYFQIASKPPFLRPEQAAPLNLDIDPDKVARLRTDLDCFSDIEIAALVNQGYNSADRFARGYMERYAKPDWNRALPVAPRPLISKERAENVLEAGSARFFRAVQLRAPATLLAILAVAVLLIAAAANGNTVRGIWSYVHGAIYALPAITRWIPEEAVPRVLNLLRGPTGVGLLGAGLLLLLAKAFMPAPKASGRARFVWLRTGVKWASSYLWFITWLIWALPLVVAASLMLITAVAWVVFFLPWRARASIRDGDIAVPASSTPLNVREEMGVRQHAD